MKALRCELCGGNELEKRDGMYVCPFCNTRYTIEEAQKLITSNPFLKRYFVSILQVKKARNLMKLSVTAARWS